MKKVFVFLVAWVAAVCGAGAWQIEFKKGLNFELDSVSTDMTDWKRWGEESIGSGVTMCVAARSKNYISAYLSAYNMFFGENVNVIEGNSNTKESGWIVTRMRKDGSVYYSGLSLAGSPHMTKPIYKAEIDYVSLNNKDFYLYGVEGSYVWENSVVEEKNGYTVRRLTIYPLFVAYTIPLFTGENNGFDNAENHSVYTVLNKKFSGTYEELASVMLTNIKIVYTTEGKKLGNTMADKVYYGCIYDKTKLESGIYESEKNALLMRYEATSGADVNEDGKVNATDVVAVYNTIINGEEVKATNTYAGQKYVDLGLTSGNLWAECNVGANVREGYGDYFAWGDQKSLMKNSKSTYEFGKGEYEPADGFNNLITGHASSKLFPAINTLYSAWSGWDIPTYNDFSELKEECDMLGCYRNDVHGILFTSKKNGRTLFLPTAGYVKDGSTSSFLCYWTCTTLGSNETALTFRVTPIGVDCEYKLDRYAGCPIRCVVRK